MTSHITHIVSLDLGQTSDPSALAVMERTGPAPCAYDCRHLFRWHLGTGYPQIVEDTMALLTRPGLVRPMLVVDRTGVGRPVVDMFRQHSGLPCAFRPVTITAGSAWGWNPDRSLNVPKKDLVGTLQVLLGHRRLRIASSLPDAPVLLRELQNFRVKITAAANEVFGAWREGQHDDLVLAVALAAWVGEHAFSGPVLPAPEAARSMMDRAGDEGVFAG